MENLVFAKSQKIKEELSYHLRDVNIVDAQAVTQLIFERISEMKRRSNWLKMENINKKDKECSTQMMKIF